MKRVAVAVVMAVVGLLGVIAWIIVATDRLLDRRYAVLPHPLAAARDADAPARGRRLADITGCTDCHRADLRGGVFIDDGWWRGRYYASNLTLKTGVYSDEDFARIVRTGVRPDGRGVVMMPAFAYSRLSDAEMADIVAFLRSLPAGGAAQPGHWVGPIDRWELWTGRHFKPAIAYVDEERRKDPPDVGPGHEPGRHLVAIVCVECHGGDLKGNGWDTGAPDLAVAAAYGPAQFVRLLREGIGADGRDHGLMSRVAKDRLHRLGDGQIADIHAYLLARARR